MTKLEREHNFSLHFLDGPLETGPDPSVEGVEGLDGPFYRWFTWSEPPAEDDFASVDDVVELMDEVVAEDGPFDGVLGFSQGASLAAHLVARQASLHLGAAGETPSEHFRFAILFSCAGLQGRAASEDKEKILVPSLHVCGKRDQDWLHKSLSVVSTRCEPGSAAVIMHEGGHDIPREGEMVDRICREVEKVLHRAMVL